MGKDEEYARAISRSYEEQFEINAVKLGLPGSKTAHEGGKVSGGGWSEFHLWGQCYACACSVAALVFPGTGKAPEKYGFI